MMQVTLTLTGLHSMLGNGAKSWAGEGKRYLSRIVEEEWEFAGDLEGEEA